MTKISSSFNLKVVISNELFLYKIVWSRLEKCDTTQIKICIMQQEFEICRVVFGVFIIVFKRVDNRLSLSSIVSEFNTYSSIGDFEIKLKKLYQENVVSNHSCNIYIIRPSDASNLFVFVTQPYFRRN